MTTAVLISLLILVTYTITVCTKYGIPESLSQSYYSISWKPLFTLVIVICGFLILPPCMDLAEDASTQIIPFLGISGLLLVAAAPRVRDYERTIHIIGASISGIFSQLWVVLYGTPQVLWSWFLIGGLMIYGIFSAKDGKNILTMGQALDKVHFIFWTEMICFFNIYASLLLS